MRRRRRRAAPRARRRAAPASSRSRPDRAATASRAADARRGRRASHATRGDGGEDARHRVRVPVAVDVRRRDARALERGELRVALAPHVGRVHLTGERATRQLVERMEAPRRRGSASDGADVSGLPATRLRCSPTPSCRRVAPHALDRLARTPARSTIIDAEDNVPAACASRIPRFTPGANPRSSALMTSSRMRRMRAASATAMHTNADATATVDRAASGSIRDRLATSTDLERRTSRTSTRGIPCGGVWMPGVHRSSSGKTKPVFGRGVLAAPRVHAHLPDVLQHAAAVAREADRRRLVVVAEAAPPSA